MKRVFARILLFAVLLISTRSYSQELLYTSFKSRGNDCSTFLFMMHNLFFIELKLN